MSGWFIFTLIISVIAAIVLLFTAIVSTIDGEPVTRSAKVIVVVVCVLVVGVFAFVSSAFVIPTRSVGVATAFGKPDHRPLANGFHLVAPWKSVEKLSTATQTLNLLGDGGKDKHHPCVTVRLGNQTTACVDVSVQWNIADEGVVDLYRQYKPRDGDVFDNIETNLVQRQATHALNVAFSTYDPLAAIAAGGASGVPTVRIDDLAAKAGTVLQAAVGAGIHIRSVTIPVVHYDSTTQDKLNAYAQAIADTRIATQRRLTAEAQKAANDALAGSAASHDPAVLYQNCLDMTERLTKEGKTLPPAWSCGAPPTTVVPVK